MPNKAKSHIQPNHIKSIGIELECGMDDIKLHSLQTWIRENNLSSYFSYDSDGSVYVYGTEISDLELRFWHTNIRTVYLFLKKAYELGAKTNSSCGFHVHVRFDDYAALTFKPYFTKFIRAYKTHFSDDQKYISRLRNSYCRASKLTEDLIASVLNSSISDRYCAINFRAIDEHGTVEFRIFPNQSTSKEAISTLRWFTNTINSILNTTCREIYKATITISPITQTLQSTRITRTTHYEIVNIQNHVPTKYTITYNKFVAKKYNLPIDKQLTVFGSLFTPQSTQTTQTTQSTQSTQTTQTTKQPYKKLARGVGTHV